MLAPDGQWAAPTLNKIYEEKSAPNSMTSDAKNSHIPKVALLKPVSGLSSTTYGIIPTLIPVLFCEP
jgi:hypothetical protein